MILSNEFSIDAPYGQNICVITCKLGQEHNLDREMNYFCYCDRQRSAPERQPVWDHHKLQNLLHSGKNPSFIQKRVYCQLASVFPGVSVHGCCQYTLCCWSAAEDSLIEPCKVCFCNSEAAICYHNNSIISLLTPLLGEQLTETLRSDGKYLVEACESMWFYFCSGMLKKKKGKGKHKLSWNKNRRKKENFTEDFRIIDSLIMIM